LDALDDLGKPVWPVEATPPLPCRLAELEDHGERRLAVEAALGLDGAQALGREGAINWVGAAQGLSVLGRKFVESQERPAVAYPRAAHRLRADPRLDLALRQIAEPYTKSR
jgi:hypothetical protein